MLYRILCSFEWYHSWSILNWSFPTQKLNLVLLLTFFKRTQLKIGFVKIDEIEVCCTEFYALSNDTTLDQFKLKMDEFWRFWLTDDFELDWRFWLTILLNFDWRFWRFWLMIIFNWRFWLTILIDDFDWRFWLTILIDDFDWRFWLTILIDDFDWRFWLTILTILIENFDWRFWLTILIDDFDWRFWLTILIDDFDWRFWLTILIDDFKDFDQNRSNWSMLYRILCSFEWYHFWSILTGVFLPKNWT